MILVNWQEYSKDIKALSDEEKMYIRLVSEIITIRKDRGLTQNQLAELSGLSQPAIARFEDLSKTSNTMTVLKVLHSLGYKISIQPVTEWL